MLRSYPLCGPLTGGTNMTIVPDDATAAFKWFLDTPSTHVRIHNDVIDLVGSSHSFAAIGRARAH